MRKEFVGAFGILFVLALAAGPGLAQEEDVDVMITPGAHGMKRMSMGAFAPQGGTYHFIAAHGGMEGKVVKNAPYSADGVTETERVLADGTRITKKTTSKVYRDSEGRTRREMTLGAVGPWAAEGEAPTTVTINDPVAGRMFVMHQGSGEAKAIDVLHPEHLMELKEHQKAAEGAEESKHEIKIIKKQLGEDGKHVEHTHDLTHASRTPLAIREGDAKTEDLGERNIEGVIAQGVRISHVIPEGKIGNDRPITITTERWFSDELQAVVMRKTTDPMSGNVTYKLTNISRAEPDPSLFEMDDDVHVIEDGDSIQRHIRVEREVREEI